MFATKIDKVIGPVDDSTLANVEELMLLENPLAADLADRPFAQAVYSAYHTLVGTERE